MEDKAQRMQEISTDDYLVDISDMPNDPNLDD